MRLWKVNHSSTIIRWSGAVEARWSPSTKLTNVGPGFYWDGWPYAGSIPGVGHLSQYVTSHSGQLSLAIPSWVGATRTSQRAVALQLRTNRQSMVRVWVAGKTAWSLYYTRAVSDFYHCCPARPTACCVVEPFILTEIKKDYYYYYFAFTLSRSSRGRLKIIILIFRPRWSTLVCPSYLSLGQYSDLHDTC